MANVRNDTISIDFDHFVHIELFLPRYNRISPCFYPPSPPSPFPVNRLIHRCLEVKPHSVFFMYCAKAPYERCVQIV